MNPKLLGFLLMNVVATGILSPLAAAQNQGALGERAQNEGVMNENSGSKDNGKGESCGFPTDDAELRKLLTPEQYRVARQNGTERPFENEFWNNKRPGIYVDVVSGEALFSSLDKFDSGTGWPSFTKPLVKDAVVKKDDSTYGMQRTEVRSSRADSHLGHLFNDGPRAAGGLRFCINSASLRFIAVEDLEKEGYGEYRKLFEGTDELKK